MSALCQFIEEIGVAQIAFQNLNGMLRPTEVSALLARARRLVDGTIFPQPLSSRRSYPWPPV
jgi:hypothetical protein